MEYRRSVHRIAELDAAADAASAHIANAGIHMTAAEKEKLASLENYDDSELQRAVAEANAMKRGTLLNASASNPIDLDTLVTAGRYYAGASNTAYITGKPDSSASVGWQLTVEEMQMTNRLIQTFVYNSPSFAGIVYRRWYTQSGWTVWYKFQGEAVI